MIGEVAVDGKGVDTILYTYWTGPRPISYLFCQVR